jgi:hypothetical protein
MYLPVPVAHLFEPVVSIVHQHTLVVLTAKLVRKLMFKSSCGTVTTAPQAAPCLYAGDSGPLVKCVKAPR